MTHRTDARQAAAGAAEPGHPARIRRTAAQGT
ncbi:UNVERIFIED_ORG: hypothetical protein CLV66_114129 [Actinomadura viridilutea]